MLLRANEKFVARCERRGVGHRDQDFWSDLSRKLNSLEDPLEVYRILSNTQTFSNLPS